MTVLLKYLLSLQKHCVSKTLFAFIQQKNGVNSDVMFLFVLLSRIIFHGHLAAEYLS